MNLEALRKKHAEALASMQAIMDKVATEARGLTDDEKAAFDKLETEANSLADSITRASRFSDAQAQANAVIPAASRSAALNHAPADPAKREFESFGEFAHAVAFNPGDQRLNWQNGLPNAEQRMDSGSAGGFMVPKQFINTLRQADTQGSIIRPRATVIPADSSTPDAEVTMPALNQSASTNSRGGVSVSWSGEGATGQETDLKFRDITLKPHEMTAIVPVTDKLLRNWAGCSALIEAKLREGVIAKEEQAFLLGDGVGKPLGVLKSGAVIKISRATVNLIKYVDICNMLAKVKLGAGAIFMINQAVLPQLMQLTDPAGNLIWQASAREGIVGTLLGYPVVFNEFCPALGLTGDISLLSLGDYLIKDGAGPLLSASSHANFTSNRTLFKVVVGVDGQPWLTEPLPREDNSVYSPFIVLSDPAI